MLTKTVTVRSFYMDEKSQTVSTVIRRMGKGFNDAYALSHTDMNGIKTRSGGKGKKGEYGDFAFNDADPEKMTATTNTCMITIIALVQLMIHMLVEIK
jgi:hypothetical protein